MTEEEARIALAQLDALEQRLDGMSRDLDSIGRSLTILELRVAIVEALRDGIPETNAALGAPEAEEPDAPPDPTA